MLFFSFLRSSLPHPVKMGYSYYGMYCLSFYLYKRKRACARKKDRETETDKPWTLGWKRGRNEGKKQKEERRQRERGMEGKKLVQGNFFFFFLLNSNPRKLCTRTPHFLLLKPKGKPRRCVNYRKKSMKILFRSPFHHSVRMVSFTF